MTDVQVVLEDVAATLNLGCQCDFGIAGFAVIALLFCLGTSFCHPTLTAMLSQRAADEHQGTVIGAANSVAAMGRIAAPPVGGLLFVQAGPNWPMLMAGLIMLPVVAAAALMSVRQSP